MTTVEEQLLFELRRARELSEMEDHRSQHIILSVKEQEQKYELLTQQLKQERQNLADQLEKVELGSETASLNSISESDFGSRSGSFGNANFQYREHVKVDDYSDTESRASLAQPPINSAHILQSTHSPPAANESEEPPISLEHRQVPNTNVSLSNQGSKSNSATATPLSPRRATNKGPQYNFAALPADKRVDVEEEIKPSSKSAQLNQSPPNNLQMRSSAQFEFHSSSHQLSNGGDPRGMNNIRARNAPDRPRLPVVYTNGAIPGRGFPDNDGDVEETQQNPYYNYSYDQEDFINYDPEQSPSLQLSPHSNREPFYSPKYPKGYNPPHQQPRDNGDDIDGYHPDYHPSPPQRGFAPDEQDFTPRGGRKGQGNFSHSDSPRPQSAASSLDPRQQGLSRHPADLERFDRPLGRDSDSVSGSQSRIPIGTPSTLYANAPTSNGNKRQPLGGSQTGLSENSASRVPLSARSSHNSNSMQVQSYPNAHHHGRAMTVPGNLMVDASQPAHHQYQTSNRFSPPHSSGMPSPSVPSRTHYPVGASNLAHTPATPAIFDVADNTTGRDQRWRNPNLLEILEYLENEDPRIVLNASGYLQHLTYEDQAVKVKTRESRGIPIVVHMLENSPRDVKKNLLGVLRNMSFGKGTVENKLEIKNQGCVAILARILKTSDDGEIMELACAILWNLSSEPDIKPVIIKEALQVLVDRVIVPESNWLEYESENNTYLRADVAAAGSKPSSPISPQHSMPEWSLMFRNATGCMRNLSADHEMHRKALREVRHLIDALVHVLNLAIIKNEVSGRAVENCICTIRNLTFHLHDELSRANDPRLDSIIKASNGDQKNTKRARSSSRNSNKSDKSKFRTNKKSTKSGTVEQYKKHEYPENDPYARGVELLWQPMIANICVCLLRESSNPDTLEAAAGTLQNLCAGNYEWCAYLRFCVRKRMGLPLMRELLDSFENDFVVAAVAGALKNICMDHENRRLIGLHATYELIKHLPAENDKKYESVYWEKVAFVLLCLTELCRQNEDNCRLVRQGDGLYRIIPLAKYRHSSSSGVVRVPQRVVTVAENLLVEMWNVKAMRKDYKEQGFVRAHFDPKAIVSVEKKHEIRTLRRNKAKSADDLNSSYGGTRSRHGTASRGGTRRRGSSSGLAAGSEANTPGTPHGNVPSVSNMEQPQAQHLVGQSYTEYNNLDGTNTRYSDNEGGSYPPHEYRQQDMMEGQTRGMDTFHMNNSYQASPINGSIASDSYAAANLAPSNPPPSHSMHHPSQLVVPNGHSPQLPGGSSSVHSHSQHSLDQHVYSSVDKHNNNNNNHLQGGGVNMQYGTMNSVSSQNRAPHHMRQALHPQNPNPSDLEEQDYV